MFHCLLGECKLQGWKGYPGSGTHVTVGHAGVFHANKLQHLFKKAKAPKHWTKFGGILEIISAGKKALWGVAKNDDIYVDRTGTGTKWVKVPGKLHQVYIFLRYDRHRNKLGQPQP